jgi:hypothetical protein
VLTHARALLTSGPEGRTAYIHADLRDPAGIVAHPVTRDVLDFTQPIALMLVGILHLIPDEDKPGDIMTTLLDSLPRAAISSRPTARRNTLRTRRTARCAHSGTRGSHFRRVIPASSPGWRSPAWN